MRSVLCWALALAVASTDSAQGPPRVTDTEVLKGIKQVDDAEYDTAIFTLDSAVRRLSGDAKRQQDLAQAYLYLGIAYMGKGHDALARAKFRAAVAAVRDIALSLERFPPKVIDALEAAREEVGKGRAPAASAPPAATGPPAPSSARKKGGGKTLLIVGGVALAGGGAALALGGGGGDGGADVPTDSRRVETFSGQLCENTSQCPKEARFDIVVASAGVLEATVTWTNTNNQAFLQLFLDDENFNTVATSTRITTTSSQVTSAVTPRTSSPTAAYHLFVVHGASGTSTPSSFNLTVRHP